MIPTPPLPRAAVYARSLDPVEVGGQVRRLRHLVRQRRWEMAGVFTDQGKPSERRPELDRLLQAVATGSVDIIVTIGLDRPARTARHLISLVTDLTASGVDLVAVEDGVDTTAGEGTAIIEGILHLGRIESALSKERGRDAIATARRRGVHVGRPKVSIDIERARRMRAEGASLREVARALNVGIGTIHKALQEAL